MMEIDIFMSGRLFWSYSRDCSFQMDQMLGRGSLVSSNLNSTTHNTKNPSDLAIYQALPYRLEFFVFLLIWPVSQASHMTSCALDYRSEYIFHYQ